MSDKKTQPELKDMRVTFKFTCSDGYRSNGDYRSNVPGARKPATAAETLMSATEQLARFAAFYPNLGAEVLLRSTENIHAAWKWKVDNGYEAGPDPRMKVLNHLANEMGFDLIPKNETAKEPK